MSAQRGSTLGGNSGIGEYEQFWLIRSLPGWASTPTCAMEVDRWEEKGEQG